MKAVILSAGQGRRLLPLTAEAPKCLLTIEETTIVEWQINQLLSSGVDQVTVVVGFGAEKVEHLLAKLYASEKVRTLYNPFYTVTDNLVSCWVARSQMTNDFVLLNGDTVFESTVIQRVLHAPAKPVTLTTDSKPAYDADDMKVSLNGQQLVRVGKNLTPEQSHAESIGLLLFRGDGPRLFCEAMDHALRAPAALKHWYLSVVDGMARSGVVWTASIQGLQWAEIDCPEDLEEARKLAASWGARPKGLVKTA